MLTLVVKSYLGKIIHEKKNYFGTSVHIKTFFIFLTLQHSYVISHLFKLFFTVLAFEAQLYYVFFIY